MGNTKIPNSTKTVNPKEAWEDAVGLLDNALDQSQVSPFPKDFIQQLIGVDTSRQQDGDSQAQIKEASAQKIQAATHGQLTEGEWIEFTKHHAIESKSTERQQKHIEVDAANQYHHEIKNFDKKAHNKEHREIDQQVREIMQELKNLINSSKMLKMQFDEVTDIDEIPEVGIYHVNFLEWMISVVKAARANIDDASSWINSASSKSKKSKGYWAMFKKHKESFALSDERQVATGVG